VKKTTASQEVLRPEYAGMPLRMNDDSGRQALLQPLRTADTIGRKAIDTGAAGTCSGRNGPALLRELCGRGAQTLAASDRSARPETETYKEKRRK
jgi:hypothetical protein